MDIFDVHQDIVVKKKRGSWNLDWVMHSLTATAGQSGCLVEGHRTDNNDQTQVIMLGIHVGMLKPPGSKEEFNVFQKIYQENVEKVAMYWFQDPSKYQTQEEIVKDFNEAAAKHLGKKSLILKKPEFKVDPTLL